MNKKENFFLVFRSEKQQVSPYIKQVYIELSTHCNLSCRSCIRNSIVDFRKCHFTPLLMRKLTPMLKKIKPERIVLVSNASFLTEEMSSYLVNLPLDELYVSWDDDIYGTDSVIRRGASADLFRKNMEALVNARTGAGTGLPSIGLQIVATKGNCQFISGTIGYGHSIGINQFIVSNVYPYSEKMTGEILYDTEAGTYVDLRKLLRGEIKKYRVRVANQKTRRNRTCPFMERGTVFITAEGDIAPCPELATPPETCRRIRHRLRRSPHHSATAGASAPS